MTGGAPSKRTPRNGRAVSLRSAAGPLAPVFHPLWSAADDHALLTARAAGDNFSAIAARLGRSRIAVEQRWHRRRVVPNVAKLLEAYGLSPRSYPADGGGHG